MSQGPVLMITQGGLSSKDGEKYGVGILPAFFLFFSISFVFVTVLALCRLFRFFYFFFRIFLLPYGRGKGFHERKRKRGVKTMHIERRISALGGYKVAGAPVAMCGDATSVQ